ncbi:hypothetical protein LBMAG53_13400 [Planctomycetota bacterium]|nr:hypothetical protein LBMAG53_13400 [Planctomycetota bacterium]
MVKGTVGDLSALMSFEHIGQVVLMTGDVADPVLGSGSAALSDMVVNSAAASAMRLRRRDMGWVPG